MKYIILILTGVFCYTLGFNAADQELEYRLPLHDKSEYRVSDFEYSHANQSQYPKRWRSDKRLEDKKHKSDI